MNPSYRHNFESAKADQSDTQHWQPRQNEHQAVADASMAPPGHNTSMCSTTAAPKINAESGAQATSSDRDKAGQITNPNPATKQFSLKPGDEYSCHIRSEKDLEDYEAMMLLNTGDDRTHMAAGYPGPDKYPTFVHALFDAMKNLAGTDEASAGTSQAGSKSDKDGIAVRLIKSKTPFEIELVAAKLMRAMRKAQLGQLSHAAKTIQECKTVQEFNSFTLRFQAVLLALKVSKLLVRSALDSDEWINRIALNPLGELQRKRMNKEVNDLKKQRIETAKTAAATKGLSPTATTSPAIPALAQQSSKKGSSGAPDVRQVGADTSPAERPFKRVRTSHDQPKLQLAFGRDGEVTFVLDPDPKDVPGPIRDNDLELYGQRHAADASQSRNSLAGTDAPGTNKTEEDEDEDDELYRFGD